MVKRGDFTTSRAAVSHVRDIHEDRPLSERQIDDDRRAPVTTDAQAWEADQDHLDFPGVDTPTGSPALLPKDLKDPAPTDTAAVARDTAPVDPLGREETAIEMFESQAAEADISLSPDEDVRGVGAVSQKPSKTTRRRGLAGGEAADMAFVEAEEKRLLEGDDT